ncbi:unnamed protein product [marine sediment metagenome]|uniref:Uncharacterized protein n=1 Tax=marine sediment metagenome TaxID=412755 RepID=X1CNU2_9ZZZZ
MSNENNFFQYSQISDPKQQEAVEDLQSLKLHHNVEVEVRNGNVVGIFFWQNWIKKLPESFSNVKHLERLTLGMNHLTYLPNSFSELKSLKELFLDGNDFEAFPEPVLYLPNL